jgi:esterase/lipase superfamily enzyme
MRQATGLHALALCLVALWLSACSARTNDSWLEPVAAPGAAVKVNRIFVATTRQLNENGPVHFTSLRSQQVSYARIDVAVPPTHKMGQVEWPRSKTPNPQKEFAVQDGALYAGDQAFIAALNAEIDNRPPGKRSITIFVHGYNNTFAEGLYRMAQLSADSERQSVPLYFAWPSKGSYAGYGYDLNSATTARDGLEHVMRLAAASHAEKINLVAHSMGNWVLMEAVRQIRIAGDALPTDKVGLVVLASPDLDIDVFKSEMQRIGRPDIPYYVIVSRDDVALHLSSLIAGNNNQVGAGYDNAELEKYGATVINMTDVKADSSFNHEKFALLAALAPNFNESVAKSLANPNNRPPGLAGLGICTPVIRVNCN